MIHRVYSDHPKFKTVLLRPGMNILAATKDSNSTVLNTRNGAGKSSLVEVIHFVLGADCDKGSIFRDPELEKDTFGLEFDLAGFRLVAERSGRRPGRVTVTNLPSRLLSLLEAEQPELSSEGGVTLSVSRWNDLLGLAWFGLPLERDPADYKFGPTFRTLFNYFCRRSDGFKSPSRAFDKQRLYQEQVLVSFLLGLDWRIPQAAERIRAKQRLRTQLRKELEESEIPGGDLPSSSVIQTHLALAQNRARIVEESLRGFKVVDQYHELEREVNDLTQRLGFLSDENSFDRSLISELEEVQRQEAPHDSTDLAAVYAEAQVVLPKRVLRQFDDVKNFHASVVKNREGYLRAEISAAESRIRDRDVEQRNIERRQSEIWSILKGAGALDTFTKLQAEFSSLKDREARLQGELSQALTFEGTGREIQIEESRLEDQLAMNHLEQADQVSRAIVTFGNVSQELYAQPGFLEVNKKLFKGPPITVHIPRHRSEGVQSMQIFCFDLTMVQICRDRGIGPGLIIHDSHLYDPVDARQVGEALRVAGEQSAVKDEHAGFQYLTLLNSDKLEQVQRETNTDLSKWVLPLSLSDDEYGGLFGRPFGTRTR